METVGGFQLRRWVGGHRDEPRCSVELWPRPVTSKVKIYFPSRKAFSVLLCFGFFFNAKILSSPNETVATDASTLVSLATARLAVAAGSKPIAKSKT